MIFIVAQIAKKLAMSPLRCYKIGLRENKDCQNKNRKINTETKNEIRTILFSTTEDRLETKCRI